MTTARSVSAPPEIPIIDMAPYPPEIYGDYLWERLGPNFTSRPKIREH